MSVVALLGGIVTAHGLGYVAPSWVGVALGVLGYALVGVSFAIDRPAPVTADAVTREPVEVR